jgi:ParB family chromosome partitioning protein
MSTKQAEAANNGHHTEWTNALLVEIVTSPTNPRKRFNEQQLSELAASIKDKGVIEPLIVRPLPEARRAENKKAKYELVAGERRWRASGIAGVKIVPIGIKQLTDEQVLEIQIEENLHRADIHPLDEADGFHHVMTTGQGMTIEELARRVSKSEEYVSKRLRLVTLIEEARKDFEDGLLSLGHVLQIAVLDQKVQPYALANAYEKVWSGSNQVPDKTRPPRNVRYLEAWIEQNVELNLRKAPFKMEDKRLREDGLTCIECPQRSGANRSLFPEIKNDDTCMNPFCFSGKTQTFIQIRRTELGTKTEKEGEPVIVSAPVISTYYSPIPETPEDAILNGRFQIIKKKDERCPTTQQAVWVDGPEIGHAAYICADPKCKDHLGYVGSRSSSSSSSSGATRDTEAEAQTMKADQQKRRQASFDERVAEETRRIVIREAMLKIGSPLKRRWLNLVAFEFFRRIPSDEQRVICSILEWDKDEKKAAFEIQRDLPKRLEKMNDAELNQFMFACAVGHYKERAYEFHEGKYQHVDRITGLAAEMKVNLRLRDAEVRFALTPKKYAGDHRRYLNEVLAGMEKSKLPIVYEGDDYEARQKAGEESARRAGLKAAESELEDMGLLDKKDDKRSPAKRAAKQKAASKATSKKGGARKTQAVKGGKR